LCILIVQLGGFVRIFLHMHITDFDHVLSSYYSFLSPLLTFLKNLSWAGGAAQVVEHQLS
jgi:hypothetical protein